MTDNILVVINAEAPSAAMHAAATTRSQARKAADGTDLPPNPVLECRSMDTSHGSLLYVVTAPTTEGKTVSVWIPYSHLLGIIECTSGVPASMGFVHGIALSIVEPTA